MLQSCCCTRGAVSQQGTELQLNNERSINIDAWCPLTVKVDGQCLPPFEFLKWECWPHYHHHLLAVADIALTQIKKRYRSVAWVYKLLCKPVLYNESPCIACICWLRWSYNGICSSAPLRVASVLFGEWGSPTLSRFPWMNIVYAKADVLTLLVITTSEASLKTLRSRLFKYTSVIDCYRI